MAEPEHHDGAVVERLRQRLALGIRVDEEAITALAQMLAVLRVSNDPLTADLEHAIRGHRIGILKQRAVLGAAGLDV